MLIESDLVAAGSMKGVISGKHYNSSVRAHKVMYEALLNLLLKDFLESLPEESQEEIVSIFGKFFTCLGY